MNETDRRQAERHEEIVPVSLVFEESVELEGATVNWSKNGVLIVANGRISVQIKIEGQHLSRAVGSSLSGGFREHGVWH